jgi:hypothetical protein
MVLEGEGFKDGVDGALFQAPVETRVDGSEDGTSFDLLRYIEECGGQIKRGRFIRWWCIDQVQDQDRFTSGAFGRRGVGGC